MRCAVAGLDLGFFQWAWSFLFYFVGLYVCPVWAFSWVGLGLVFCLVFNKLISEEKKNHLVYYCIGVFDKKKEYNITLLFTISVIY